MQNAFSVRRQNEIRRTEMTSLKRNKAWVTAGLGMAVILLFTACPGQPDPVTTASLLDEMTDLDRLTRLPEYEYHTVQFSSYDRRSTKPGSPGWFGNEDGFGNEPLPGFEKVLTPPDSNGTGVYLICDVKGPGAILRLWTAEINGEIRLFLDNKVLPVYEGKAAEFFYNPCAALLQNKSDSCYAGFLRQFDASYFPIPFATGCRIEWTGDIRKPHFYHAGIRLYPPGTPVRTFRADDIARNAQKLDAIRTIFGNPGIAFDPADGQMLKSEIRVPPGSRKELFMLRGMQEIDHFSVRIRAGDPERALRENLLIIRFDSSSFPQVHAPVGDFFGSAPGLNPYQSLPFSVESDSTLVCRFRMPFRHTARIEIENKSEQDITVLGNIHTTSIQWEEGKNLYFMTHWQIDNGLTASDINAQVNTVTDIPFLSARGTGRLAGTAVFIYNPSNVPTSWGNWWGEGDEKISVDRDTFPSVFGTGSEDYFNYSWSSDRIFSYPYCGQTRNDGPGNRGYVSDFRWHIMDDIPFWEKINFSMELGHHGRVPDFSYGRIVYFYALPGINTGYQKITAEELEPAGYKNWIPEAYGGSAGFRFIQAEDLLTGESTASIEKGKLWAGGQIVMWRPLKDGEKIRLQLNAGPSRENTRIGFTMVHSPRGGEVSVSVNGKKVKFDGRESIILYEPVQQLLRNHFSESINLDEGINNITLESANVGQGTMNGIDFIWIREL